MNTISTEIEEKGTRGKYTAKSPTIKGVIEKIGATHAEIATRLDVSESTVGKLSSGHRELSLDMATKFADEYGYTLDYLYGRPDSAQNNEFGEAAKALAAMQKYFKLTHDDETDKLFVDISDTIIEFYEKIREIEKFIQNTPALSDNKNSLMSAIVSDYNSKIGESENTKRYMLIPRGREADVEVIDGLVTELALQPFGDDGSRTSHELVPELFDSLRYDRTKFEVERDKESKVIGFKDADAVNKAIRELKPSIFGGEESAHVDVGDSGSNNWR